MRKIRVWGEMNCVYAQDERVIEVPDDATSEQIEEEAEEAAADMFTWGWENAPKEDTDA